jgi:hypothetical protein
MQVKTHDVGSEIHAEPGEKLMDCPKEQVVDLASRQGYVLFSGFSPTVDEYEAFTAQFGTCANTREVHYPESGVGLGFHAEDAYNPYRPDSIWFFCAYEGSDGGVPTAAVDGVELLESLPPRWQTFCHENRVRFDRQWNAETWQGAEPVTSREELARTFDRIRGVEYEFLPDDSLYIGLEMPLLTRTPDGRESFANTILQAATDPEYYGMTLATGAQVPEELLAIAEKEALARERPVGWKTGDVAVIDNLRMMHRRSQYVQRDRDLRVRHCEDFFGTELPDASTPIALWAKNLIQGDIDLPARVGRPSQTAAVAHA